MFTAPFVLLDDARENGAPARLYRAPVRIVRADTPEAVRPALDALRAATAEGLHAAGMMSYEAGMALAPRSIRTDKAAPESAATDRPARAPLLWFGLFNGYETIAADAVARTKRGPSAWPAFGDGFGELLARTLRRAMSAEERPNLPDRQRDALLRFLPGEDAHFRFRSEHRALHRRR